MSAREEVLARVRSALGPAPIVPGVARGYRRAGEGVPVGQDELLDLLEDRLVDYRAGVRRCGPDEVGAAVAAALAGLAPGAVVAVPAGLPPGWTEGLRAAGAEVRTDDPAVPAAELDSVAAVVTGAAVAVAVTGTIVLDASADQGRRALTLVPDVHVCVVRAEEVVLGVPEALVRLDPTRPQTWISGPSATSDIELERVEGVHGPRTLEVVLVAAGAG